jgi:hypothetical protein
VVYLVLSSVVLRHVTFQDKDLDVVAVVEEDCQVVAVEATHQGVAAASVDHQEARQEDHLQRMAVVHHPSLAYEGVRPCSWVAEAVQRAVRQVRRGAAEGHRLENLAGDGDEVVAALYSWVAALYSCEAALYSCEAGLPCFRAPYWQEALCRHLEAAV